MNTDDLKKWVKDPQSYRWELAELMREDPEILAPYAAEIAKEVAFTREYANHVNRHHRRYVYGNFVDSDFMARLLNSGVYMDWPEWRWRKHSKSRIALNGKALVQMPKLGQEAGSWAREHFAGFENEDDAVDAMECMNLSKRVGVIDQIASAYATVPLQWWDRITPKIQCPRDTWVLVRKLKWRKRSYIYAHMTDYQKDRNYLPGSVYGTRDEAIRYTDPGIVFNRNVRLDDKLRYLDEDEGLAIWFEARHYYASDKTKTKTQPRVPKHVWCPGSVTLNLREHFLSDKELGNLYLIMQVFSQLKLTGAVQAFEHMLNPESPMGADFAKWKEQGRIR